MYRDVLAPVVECLEKRQTRTVSLYDQEPLSNKRGQEVHSIWEYNTSELTHDIRNQHRELRKWSKRWLANDMLPRIIRDRARPLWPQIGDLFQAFFWVRLPGLIAQASIARRVLEIYHPTLLISVDVADSRSRLYTLLGKKYGIPSLEVQFGLAGPEGIEWQFFDACHLAVRSQRWYDALLRHGVPAGKMTVTGSPVYDDRGGETDGAIIRSGTRDLGVPPAHRLALFASFWSHTTVEKWANSGRLDRAKRLVFEAASRVRGLTLVVKPHPRENVARTRALAGDFRNIVFVSAEEDIRNLIPVCDVFVSFGSTTIQSALIAHKPVIYPYFEGLLWWSDDDMFLKSGAVYNPRSVQELEHVLNSVVDGSILASQKTLEPARKQFLQDWIHSDDGQAANRIAILAGQMALPSRS